MNVEDYLAILATFTGLTLTTVTAIAIVIKVVKALWRWCFL